jgi:hypothetical protein
MVVRRRVLLLLLGIVGSYGALVWRDRSARPARWVGVTECGWRGSPKVIVRGGLRPIDSVAVDAHERVHAEQCKALGPVRYRWRNLTGAGKLGLEVPAYCAGARVRARTPRDTAFVRSTMTADLLVALADVVDSTTIVRAVDWACPEFARR